MKKSVLKVVTTCLILAILIGTIKFAFSNDNAKDIAEKAGYATTILLFIITCAGVAYVSFKRDLGEILKEISSPFATSKDKVEFIFMLELAVKMGAAYKEAFAKRNDLSNEDIIRKAYEAFRYEIKCDDIHIDVLADISKAAQYKYCMEVSFKGTRIFIVSNKKFDSDYEIHSIAVSKLVESLQ